MRVRKPPIKSTAPVAITYSAGYLAWTQGIVGAASAVSGFGEKRRRPRMGRFNRRVFARAIFTARDESGWAGLQRRPAGQP